MVGIYTLLPSEDVSSILLATMNKDVVFCAILSDIIAKARYKAGYYLKFKVDFKLFHGYTPPLFIRCKYYIGFSENFQRLEVLNERYL